MRRNLLNILSKPSEGNNLIVFYIDPIECIAEEGMTFKEWIFSDYFDITNPYNIVGPNLDLNVREFVELYGDNDLELISHSGLSYTPQIYIQNTIIPNCAYLVDGSGTEKWD